VISLQQAGDRPPFETLSDIIGLPPYVSHRTVRLAETTGARQERYLIQHAVGRHLASQLLRELGATNLVVTREPDRSPRWPHGFIGSISHTSDFVMVAVAKVNHVRAIGIDCESIVSRDEREAINSVCLNEAERHLCRSISDDKYLASTVCFSAKEALFKAIYSLTRAYFGFEDARVLDVDLQRGTLHVELVRAQTKMFPEKSRFCGSVCVKHSTVFTSFVLRESGLNYVIAG
jgi:enterobactin synthetase component D